MEQSFLAADARLALGWLRIDGGDGERALPVIVRSGGNARRPGAARTDDTVSRGATTAPLHTMHETSSTSSSTTASRQQTVFDRRAPAADAARRSRSAGAGRARSACTQVSRYDAGVPMSSKRRVRDPAPHAARPRGYQRGVASARRSRSACPAARRRTPRDARPAHPRSASPAGAWPRRVNRSTAPDGSSCTPPYVSGAGFSISAIVTSASEAAWAAYNAREIDIGQRVAVHDQQLVAVHQRERARRPSARTEERLFPRVAHAHAERGAIADDGRDCLRAVVQVDDRIAHAVRASRRRMCAMSGAPATGRAGLARSHESGRRRVPRPGRRARGRRACARLAGGRQRRGRGDQRLMAAAQTPSNSMSVSGRPRARRYSMKRQRYESSR